MASSRSAHSGHSRSTHGGVRTQARRRGGRGEAAGAAPHARGSARRWSAQVSEHSDAMDLAPGVFKRRDPRSIALSIKRSAERSHRRKSEPFRSAMSMLTFYINRAGRALDAGQRQRLQAAKSELRALFHRDPPQRSSGRRARALVRRTTDP